MKTNVTEIYNTYFKDKIVVAQKIYFVFWSWSSFTFIVNGIARSGDPSPSQSWRINLMSLFSNLVSLTP